MRKVPPTQEGGRGFDHALVHGTGHQAGDSDRIERCVMDGRRTGLDVALDGKQEIGQSFG
jgi:hypothetical protein